MAVTEWTLKHYSLGGSPIAANYAHYPFEGDGGSDETIRHASNRQWTQVLNSLDFMRFTLDLYDPMAAVIQRKTSIVKLWRNVNDTAYGKSYTAPADKPDFAGLVVGTTKDGAAGTMDVTVMSPLWRLQTHFHILNHHLYLDVDPTDPALQGGNMDNDVFDQSALMWYLIDLVNAAFGTSSNTGILKPTTGPPYWPKTVQVGPYFIAKGSNTWSNIFDDLMQRSGGADLAPEYYHANADSGLMYFKTLPKLGSIRAVNLDYHTGDFNLENLTEDAQLQPGKFGNYVWVVADGGPNVYYALAEDVADRTANGIYMVLDEIPGAKKLTVDAVAEAHLAKAKNADTPVYSVAVSPTKPPYNKTDYWLGDVVTLNADKGALLVSGVRQRIYQIDLAMSENNVETAQLTIAQDYVDKVV